MIDDTTNSQIEREDNELPLAGMLVIDFSQFLSGPVAAVRLADLGARVVKVERPSGGDSGRQLAFAGLMLDGDPVSFHAMNRGKESLTADLKDDDDLALVRRLVDAADVVIQNFRPGVMARLGLDYDRVRVSNPGLIYATVSGYGEDGPWVNRPGQDLLAQAVTAVPYLNGSADAPPTAVGVSIADILASVHLASGVLALLLRRERTGRGGRVDTSLLECMLDLQFELLSARLVEPELRIQRGGRFTAHPFVAAPYGIYPTTDGHVALAMGSVPDLGAVIGLSALESYTDPETWWSSRDEIAELIGAHLATRTTSHWLALLEPADVWCAPVYDLEELINHDAFRSIGMTSQLQRDSADGHGNVSVPAIGTPLRIDGSRPQSVRSAPHLGEHTEQIRAEYTASEATP